MRLTLVNRVGFKWMVDRLSGLSAYVESIGAENEQLNAYLDSSGARSGYESYLSAQARAGIDSDTTRSTGQPSATEEAR
jgi:hypothetical protein